MDDQIEEPSVPPLKDALTYPFRNSGIWVLVVGAVLSVVLSLVSWFGMLSIPVTLISLAYFNAYYFRIVESTVAGKDEPPEWPDISDLIEGIVLPFVRTVGVWLISFGPYLAVLALTYDGESPWGKPLVWAALAWAVCYFPMAILNVIVSNEMGRALPWRVLPMIRRRFPAYLGLVLLLVAGIGISGLLQGSLTSIPVIGRLLSAGVGLYFMMALARGAGLFYVEHLEELEMEDEPPSGASPSGSGPA